MNVSKDGCPRTPAAGAVSSYRLSPRGCCTLSRVGHLTATTVRVGAFVSGVRNSLGTFLANVCGWWDPHD